MARTILETPRLVLREFAAEDLDFMAGLLGDPEVMRWFPSPLTREQARDWIARQWVRYAMDGHGYWLALDRETGDRVGQIGLLMQAVESIGGERRPEVAYMLHPSVWRRGLATEGATAVRDHALEALGYPAVMSLIRPENEASAAVAKRIGMRPVTETVHAGLLHHVYAYGDITTRVGQGRWTPRTKQAHGQVV